MSSDLPQKSPQPRLRRTRLLVVILVFALLAGGGWAGRWWWVRRTGLQDARRLAAQGRWREVRSRLTSYLELHEHDEEAHLLMAEAYVKGDSDSDPETVEIAIKHLRQIEHETSLAAKARLQEARLQLLILRRPTAAEASLRKSIGLQPDSYDANYLLWRLLDLTGRHTESAPFFWRVFELSPPNERALRLREWFLSEFFPESSNAEFDRAMGIGAKKNRPAIVDRFLAFREAEPSEPVAHAGLAAYFLSNGQPRTAIELLKKTTDLERAMQNAFYVQVLFLSLVELGEFDKAKACFQQWPAPHTGYEYWRSLGTLHARVTRNFQPASNAFDKALATWPGKYDWSLMSQQAKTLEKLKNTERARALEARVRRLTGEIMTKEKVKSLREALKNPTDTITIEMMWRFYEQLNQTQEARAWKQLWIPPNTPSNG